MRTEPVLRAILSVFLLLFLVACGSSGPGDGGGPPNGDPLATVIFETTKIADADTRYALTSFDPGTGEMRFSHETALLADLGEEDVLVGEPSAAAPDGYLRMVTAITRNGDEVVLTTTQARLIDAISQGQVDAEIELTDLDLESTETHVQGVTTGGLPDRDGVERSIGVGHDYGFTLGFDQVVLDFGEGATAQVTVQGEIGFNAGFGVSVDIRPCLRFPPACVRSFVARAGFEESVAISVSGEANATVQKEIKVRTYTFRTFTIWIGPVPVIVRPVIDVYIGASGEINLAFDYGFTQTAQAQVGARWTPGGGWEDITGTSFDLDARRDFSIEATMRARAYVKPAASLRLYGVAGPYLALSLAAEVDAVFPRDPVWIARGIIIGSFGFVVDIPVIGRLADYETTVFTIIKELARAESEPPEVVITAPTDGASFTLGTEILFEASATGIVGNSLPLTWSLAGTQVVTQPNNIGGHTLFYDELPAGSHTITARAQDTATGLQSEAQVSVSVTYDPPLVFVVAPKVGAGNVIWANAPLLLIGHAEIGNFALPSESLSWRVASGGPVLFSAVGQSVTVPAGIMQPGSYQITLTADDGITTADRTITVSVIAKPPGYPTGTIISPAEDDVYADGAPITFTGSGTDPEDGVLPGTAFRWTADRAGAPTQLLCEGSDFAAPGTPYNDCSSFTASLQGFDGPGGVGTAYGITLEVRDSDGNVDPSAQVSIRVITQPTP